MSFTDNIPRFAGCLNVANCSIAQAGNTVEWYRGAGEYCPECGEALVPREPAQPAQALDTSLVPATLETPVAPAPAGNGDDERAADSRRQPAPAAEPPSPPQRAQRGASRRPATAGRRWISAGLILLAAAVIAGYLGQRNVWGQLRPSGLISVCPVPIARGLAADLVRAYAAKSGNPQTQFEIADDRDCDVRFSTAAATPQDVIATDGIVAVVNPLNGVDRISEAQLRDIFRGAIKDWSALGGPSEPIVPILPGAGTDEAKALTLYGFAVGPNVVRGGTSADVTRIVTGADRRSRASIGMVAFSAAVPAKVVPLAYLPAPSVLSIASHRYPFTITIAIGSDTGRSDAVTSGFIDFARSSDGAAVVEQNGFVPREAQ